MPRPIPRWQVASTAAIAILTTVSSGLGLLRPGHYPAVLLPQFYVQDVLVLGLAVPVLLGGLWLALQGSLRGRVVWLGTLAYMTYIWASTGLQVPFNQFFLGYVALFGLSLFTFVGGTLAVDTTAVRRAVEGSISERLYGAFLLVIAAGLAVLWLAELVPATLTGEPPLLVEEQGPMALVSHFVDLSVVVPALTVVAVGLLRRRTWGYALAGVGVVFGALVAPTITGMTVAILLSGGLTVPPVAVVFTVLPALLVAALAVAYLRAMAVEGRVRRPPERGQPT
jgi:hypothetical protein